MQNLSPLAQLRAVVSRILDTDKQAYGELFTACNELYTLLMQLTDTNENDELNRENISLQTGNALGLTWAAMCIKEFARTKEFMDGVYEAVSDLLPQKAGKPVKVLYAGTGPFATLILPLITHFSSEQVQFILLDINEKSLACLQKMFALLELEGYVHHIEQVDATAYSLPAGEEVDIFITETMLNALRKEPQVAICMHIVPQLPPHVVMIPEQITLQVGFLDTKQRATNDTTDVNNGVHVLDTIFVFDKELIQQHAPNYQQQPLPFSFLPVTVDIPHEPAEKSQSLYIFTDITIYKEARLTLNRCSLNLPMRVANLTQPLPTAVTLQYQISEMPGIQHTFLTS
jgi:hypothetical protein